MAGKIHLPLINGDQHGSSRWSAEDTAAGLPSTPQSWPWVIRWRVGTLVEISLLRDSRWMVIKKEKTRKLRGWMPKGVEEVDVVARGGRSVVGGPLGRRLAAPSL